MSLLYITEEVIENFSGSGMDLLFEVLSHTKKTTQNQKRFLLKFSQSY